MENGAPVHTPVMTAEVLEFLAPSPGKTFLDATAGAGQHASAILKKIAPGGQMVLTERDSDMLELARSNLKSQDVSEESWQLFRMSYLEMDEAARMAGLSEEGFDGIFFDLGIASPHVDIPERGFSFQKEGPLDFRFDRNQSLTGEEVVNSLPEKDLKRIFREYGDERFAGAIARKICRQRQKKRITTTTELADIVKYAIPPRFRHGKKDPSTRIFQSLRIFINDEINILEDSLPKALRLLKSNGRCVVLSYHSGEDRIVKNCFRDAARRKRKNPEFELLTKKPVRPSREETRENPRARSARLRCIRRIRPHNPEDDMPENKGLFPGEDLI